MFYPFSDIQNSFFFNLGRQSVALPFSPMGPDSASLATHKDQSEGKEEYQRRIWGISLYLI